MGMLGRCIGDTFPRVPRICACPLYVLPNESNSYDANGNRTNTGDVTGADNELLSDGTYNYSYDANGNLVKQVTIADNAEIDYAYDFRNRLVKVTNKDSNGLTTQVVDYSYDAFNRLVTRTLTPYTNGVAGTPASGHFVYDGDNMVLTLDSAGNVTDRVLYGPAVDQVFAEEGSSGDVTWTLGDNQNTIRDLAQYNAATGVTDIVNHRAFSAFGQLLSETDPTTGQAATVSSSFGYTGCYFDSATGLQWNVNRWYNPSIERWMGQDPISADINLYRYCHNNPILFVDPSGLIDSVSATMAQYAAAVGAASTAEEEAVGELGSATTAFEQALANPQNVKALQAAQQALNAATTKLGNAMNLLDDKLTPLKNLIADSRSASDCAKAAQQAAANASQAADDAIAAANLANKLNHIFGSPGHNLGPLVQASGGSVVNAYNSILNAATQAVQQGNITGVFNNLPVTVAGQQIIVRGNAANGAVQIGTAFAR